jgi:hypothetical protein
MSREVKCGNLFLKRLFYNYIILYKEPSAPIPEGW